MRRLIANSSLLRLRSVVAMSIYSQSYPGQPSYGAASYTHPSMQSGYPYPYLQPSAPPPPPQLGAYHFLDPAGFRREFTARLSELQVNSRPIIQNLSMLAQDYSRFAEIVAQSLEEHIRRVSFILFRHLIKPRAFISYGHYSVVLCIMYLDDCCDFG